MHTVNFKYRGLNIIATQRDDLEEVHYAIFDIYKNILAASHFVYIGTVIDEKYMIRRVEIYYQDVFK